MTSQGTSTKNNLINNCKHNHRDELAKAQSMVDQTKVDMLLRAENSLRGITLPLYDYEELGKSVLKAAYSDDYNP